MQPFVFEASIVARAADGALIIALLDGETMWKVALLKCRIDAARALEGGIAAVLRDKEPRV